MTLYWHDEVFISVGKWEWEGCDRRRESGVTLAAVPVVSWAADQVAQGGAEPNSAGRWTQGQLEAQTANTYWKNFHGWLCAYRPHRICRVGKIGDGEHRWDRSPSSKLKKLSLQKSSFQRWHNFKKVLQLSFNFILSIIQAWNLMLFKHCLKFCGHFNESVS